MLHAHFIIFSDDILTHSPYMKDINMCDIVVVKLRTKTDEDDWDWLQLATPACNLVLLILTQQTYIPQ